MLIIIEKVLFFDESDIVGDMKSEEDEEGVEGGRYKKKKKVRGGDYKIIIVVFITTITNPDYQVQKGGYKTKEEIHKPPTFDHPCNLTRTTVRILNLFRSGSLTSLIIFPLKAMFDLFDNHDKCRKSGFLLQIYTI